MMKNIYYILFCIVLSSLLCLSTKASAQESIDPDDTYLFVKRDTCDLFMDVYNPASGSEVTFMGKTKPTIVFMFGGGFIEGERDDEFYKPWFKTLAENGYRVISIDYRLGLKGMKKMGVAQVKALDKAIHMAVEDLFSATAFILENAEQLGVDPEGIVISGSSAGAISVMQADYELSNRTSWASVLPENFRYAGVMSFAGAVFSTKGKLDYASAPAPTLMLHGTADKVVDYNQIRFLNYGFFGSNKIAQRFNKFGFGYNIYRFKDYGHEIAGKMSNTFDIQKTFLENNVIMGHKRFVDAIIDDPRIEKGGSVASLDDLYK